MNRSCARAPVRIDPAGGGTDAPPFSVEEGGRVVNIAVERHVFASAERLPAGAGILIRSEVQGDAVWAPSIDRLPGGPLGLLQGLVRRLGEPGDDLLLVTDSDVPAGAGLGGSGALGVAVAGALDGLHGRARTAEETAAVANDVERRDLGFPGGSQDSYAAALGGVNDLRYLVGGGIEPRPLRLAEPFRLLLEARTLLIYTSEAHVSGNIHRDIKESYALPASPTRQAMMDLRDAAAAMAGALEAEDLDGFARAMERSSGALYRLHPSCDCEAHRRCFRALEGLILGGKTCGAGGGGFLAVTVKPAARRECIRRVEALGASVVPLRIDFEGLRKWTEGATPPETIAAWRRDAREVAS